MKFGLVRHRPQVLTVKIEQVEDIGNALAGVVQARLLADGAL